MAMRNPAAIVHPIAKYLPADARAEAARQRYTLDETGAPRCAYGDMPRLYCPLGVALLFMGAPRMTMAAPTSAVITSRLTGMGTGECRTASWSEVYGAVSAFVNAWDGGRIDPATLPVLFDVDTTAQEST